ncbi:MAG: hypothetical protein EBT82_05255 [Micrococcales bacterium]|nr:hypothetical protein [Micrococcales bacterium]NBR61993.1 hypothetical protein [Actinomycetota bacterium]NBT49458.1 hypothetical protein [Actinomycetota bacterium]
MALSTSTIASLIIAGTAIGGTVTVVAVSHANSNEKSVAKVVVQPETSPTSDPGNIQVIPSVPVADPTPTPEPTNPVVPISPTTPPNFGGNEDDDSDDDYGDGPNGDDDSDENYSGHHGHHDDDDDD